MASVDTQFRALADHRRRTLLYSLTRDNPQSIQPDAERHDERDYRIAMYHVHLPKLVEMGFVDWDRQTGQITRGPAFEEIEPLLELLAENEQRLSI